MTFKVKYRWQDFNQFKLPHLIIGIIPKAFVSEGLIINLKIKSHSQKTNGRFAEFKQLDKALKPG